MATGTGGALGRRLYLHSFQLSVPLPFRPDPCYSILFYLRLEFHPFSWGRLRTGFSLHVLVVRVPDFLIGEIVGGLRPVWRVAFLPLQLCSQLGSFLGAYQGEGATVDLATILLQLLSIQRSPRCIPRAQLPYQYPRGFFPGKGSLLPYIPRTSPGN